MLLPAKKNALIYKICKKLVDSNSMSEETRRHLKPVATRPEVMYGSCKVYKKCVDGCPSFRPSLSALQTVTYKLEKYLVPILEPLTKNKCIVKDSFNFTTEIVEQDSSNFMRSLDIDSLFTNIPVEKPLKFALIIFLKTVTWFEKNDLKIFYL